MATNDSEIVQQFRLFRVYKNGQIELTRPKWETVPPSDDSITGVSSKDVIISSSPAAPVSARVFLPKLSNPNQKFPLLFYIHGGGFCMLSAFSPIFHYFCSTVSAQSNAVVLSVEYGLFPDRPLPGCYEDSWTALQWVATHVDGSGPFQWLNDHVNFDRVFVGGDSAGGNIAHNLAVRVGRSGQGRVKLAGLILVHPFFGGTVDDEMWVYMCKGDTNGLQDPRLKPSAEDLASLGCGKVLVFIAGDDHLNVVGRNYCESLRKSGWLGSVEIFESGGEDHVFHLRNPNSDKAKELLNNFVSFINQA